MRNPAKRWLTALANLFAYGSFILLLAVLIMGFLLYHFSPWPPS
jgi:hypothetical protein